MKTFLSVVAILISIISLLFTLTSTQLNEAKLIIRSQDVTFKRGLDTDLNELIEADIAISNIGKSEAVDVAFKAYASLKNDTKLKGRKVIKLFDEEIINPIQYGSTDKVVSFTFNPELINNESFILIFKLYYKDLYAKNESKEVLLIYHFSPYTLEVRPLTISDFDNSKTWLLCGLKDTDNEEFYEILKDIKSRIVDINDFKTETCNLDNTESRL